MFALRVWKKNRHCYKALWRGWFPRCCRHNHFLLNQVELIQLLQSMCIWVWAAWLFACKVKGKSFPLQAWEGSWDSRRLRLLDLLDTRHYEGGKVVTFTHRPPSPPGVFLVFLEAESTPGHMVPSKPRKKFPAKPLGTDPETFRLVAQCLNHWATPGPPLARYQVEF